MLSKILCSVLGILIFNCYAQAEVKYHRREPAANPEMLITGKIEAGDFEKALQVVQKSFEEGELSQLFVQLDTPGGDVVEAMKIGKLVRGLNLTTINMVGQCNSSCFFILVAGANRISASGVGIHRPYFEKEYFANLSSQEAKAKYSELMNITKNYLSEMGVAKNLIERMYRVPSNEIEEMSLEDVKNYISGSPAILDEWLIAKCGSYTKEESNDYSMWMAGMAKLKSGYLSYLKEKIERVDSCRNHVVIGEREKFFESYISHN